MTGGEDMDNRSLEEVVHTALNRALGNGYDFRESVHPDAIALDLAQFEPHCVALMIADIAPHVVTWLQRWRDIRAAVRECRVAMAGELLGLTREEAEAWAEQPPPPFLLSVESGVSDEDIDRFVHALRDIREANGEDVWTAR